MKLLIAVSLAAGLTATSRAASTEYAILAAMKLSEAPNYAWTCTVVDDARTYTIEGKTQRDSCTWIRLPMVIDVARRLGPRAGTEIEAFFRGNERSVIHTSKGWQALRELPREHHDWTDADEWRFSQPDESSRWTLANTRPAAADGDDSFRRLLQAEPALNDGADDVPRSNAQFGVSHPHEELAVIVSCHTSLNVEGDQATGTLSDLGAQLLLVRDGQDNIKPLGAAGSFRLQIKHGMVVGYLLRLEGILEVNRERIHVHQYSHTVVQNVGTTRFEAPDEARRKLGLPIPPVSSVVAGDLSHPR
jgi:hypothetical protein